MSTRPRVLVVGAGSIGRRHAAELTAAGADVTVTDPYGERAAGVPGAVGVLPFDEAWGGFDGIVLASPTLAHADQAVAALATGTHVLVEKPLATTSADAARIEAAADGRVMVGYNLRLHEPVARTVALVHEGRAGRVLGARVWFGSHLPDWRPGVDYRTTYSARADLGGGVLLDAIHELDILVWLLGEELEIVGAVVTDLGGLEIDVEDTVRALLRTSDGVPVEVALDYRSRRYRRGIEVIGDEATIRLDWSRQVVEIEDADGVVTEAADTPVARSYTRQAERFLAWLRGEAAPPVDAATGAASVSLAERIRSSAS